MIKEIKREGERKRDRKRFQEREQMRKRAKDANTPILDGDVRHAGEGEEGEAGRREDAAVKVICGRFEGVVSADPDVLRRPHFLDFK